MLSIKNKPHLSLEHNDPCLRKRGEDEMGLYYMETLSTVEDEVYNTTCPICHKHVDKGFLCLDGGEVYHDDCVVFV